MSKIFFSVISVLTIIFFSGCYADRCTTAPGGTVISAADYAKKHWQSIAKPIPLFMKTIPNKTLEESEKILAQYNALFQKYAPYLPEEYKTLDRVLNWPQGTYLKRMIWPLDGAAMYPKKAMSVPAGQFCRIWRRKIRFYCIKTGIQVSENLLLYTVIQLKDTVISA